MCLGVCVHECVYNYAYNDFLQEHWRDRSRGFLWDWADREQDDDPTKNYPFPVPRIRNISNKFRTPCCQAHLQKTKKKKMQKTFAANKNVMYIPPPLPNHNINDGDYTSSDENSDNSSDLALQKQPDRNSDAKSLMEEPPDASQQEIAKAKLKLLHNNHNLEM